MKSEVSVREFRSARTLGRLLRGESLRLVRRGRVIADVVPVRSGPQRKARPDWSEILAPVVARLGGKTFPNPVLEDRRRFRR